jgi:hypothetical protein
VAAVDTGVAGDEIDDLDGLLAVLDDRAADLCDLGDLDGACR